MSIRAIETRYAGCRFRSRLEARWAVFFDALKIKWEYEPEAYELERGLVYMPDFLLREPKSSDIAFIEIKPYTPNSVERLKLKLLCDGYDGRAEGIFLFGVPGDSAPLAYKNLCAEKHWQDCASHSMPLSLALALSPYLQKDGDYEDIIGPALEKARGQRFEFGDR